METIVLRPDGSLGEFLDKLYVNYSDAFEYRGIAEPLLGQEVFFSFGDWFQVGPYTFPSPGFNYPAVVGNRCHCSLVNASGKHLTAGILFKPWGLHALYGVDGRRTANQVACASRFPAMSSWKDSFSREANPSPAVILETMEAHIRKRTQHRSPQDRFLRAFSALDKTPFGEVDLREVASEAGFSPKAFIGLFNEHLGLSPLKYVHTKVILQALESLKNGGYTSLTRLALDLGFYDQSHFIRVFRSHMGMTPTQFKQACA